MKFGIWNLELGKGFTLLEVVVAMAIVGLGVVTLLEVFSSGLRLGAKGAEQTEAVGIGRQVMDKVLSRRELTSGREDGEAGEGYRWSLQINPMRDSTDLLLSSPWELKEVSLELGSSVRLKTLRLVNKTESEK